MKKEINDQVLLIVKYVRELKQAEDKINVAIKRGMHIG